MSATTPHAARPTRRRPASRPPRRVSGPASRRTPRAAAGGAVAAAPPLALRLGRRAGRIVDARFLDRLLRGRVWIALLALGLMGIVFIQVSMLRLNAGISRAVTSAETLHRQNATLRADLSKLDASERIADAAKSFGMIQPAAGSVRYLDARKASATAAVRGIRQPKAPAPAATTAAPTVVAAAATPTATAPAATTPTTTTAPAQTTPAQTTPAQTAPVQPAQTTPVQTTPMQTAPVQQTRAAPAQQTTPPAQVQPVTTQDGQ
jgi:hypothetical protein